MNATKYPKFVKLIEQDVFVTECINLKAERAGVRLDEVQFVEGENPRKLYMIIKVDGVPHDFDTHSEGRLEDALDDILDGGRLLRIQQEEYARDEEYVFGNQNE